MTAGRSSDARGAHGRVGALLIMAASLDRRALGAPQPDRSRHLPDAEPSGNPSGPPQGQGHRPARPPQDAKPDSDPDAANEATAAAVLAALTAYCRPNLQKGAWIAALSPLLTAAGAVAYNTVTRRRSVHVGHGRVDRPRRRRRLLFRINVPTDAGTYEVYVTRPATTDPWLVERMAPAE